MSATTAYHRQSWCESCAAGRCTGEHGSEAVAVPLTGYGWASCDMGAVVPSLDVMAMWSEGYDDSAAPAVYVGVTVPPDYQGAVQGRLDVREAIRLRDALTAAIDAATSVLHAEHHVWCTCGEREGQR